MTVGVMIKNTPTVPQFGEWISVEDRLPELIDGYASGDVVTLRRSGTLCLDRLLKTVCGAIFASERENPDGETPFDKEDEIEYWFPLPEKPKEGDSE